MQCGVVVPASSEMKRFSNLFEDFVFLCFLSKVTRHACMKRKCASAWWDARASSDMERCFHNLFEDFVFVLFFVKGHQTRVDEVQVRERVVGCARVVENEAFFKSV